MDYAYVKGYCISGLWANCITSVRRDRVTAKRF